MPAGRRPEFGESEEDEEDESPERRREKAGARRDAGPVPRPGTVSLQGLLQMQLRSPGARERLAVQLQGGDGQHQAGSLP